jgi:Uma2 family endonuclease
LVEWRSQVTEGDRAEVLGLVSGQDQTQVIDASWGYRQAGRSYYRRGNLAVDVATEDEGHLLLNWVDVDPPRRRGYVYTELRTNVADASKLPDVAFYRRRPRESRRKHALEVADLAIEILSPRDDLDEQRAKCQWYLEHGAQVAMLVDPVQRTVTVFEPAGQVEVFSSPATVVLLPDLELALDEVFSVLDV